MNFGAQTFLRFIMSPRVPCRQKSLLLLVLREERKDAWRISASPVFALLALKGTEGDPYALTLNSRDVFYWELRCFVLGVMIFCIGCKVCGDSPPSHFGRPVDKYVLANAESQRRRVRRGGNRCYPVGFDFNSDGLGSHNRFAGMARSAVQCLQETACLLLFYLEDTSSR